MISIKIKDYLPSIYESFLSPDFFENQINPETSANCTNCVMCKPKNLLHEEGRKYFHPDVKCCTFHPRLPNYLVGAILADDSKEMKEGQKRILKKIEEKISVTPTGILRPEKFELLYQNVTDGSFTAFGNALSLTCPYLNDGKCSVWKYRNSICTTWFCKSDNGVDGFEFWNSLNLYLGAVESKLVKYILFSLEMPANSVPQFFEFTGNSKIILSKESLDDKPLNDKAYKNLWGKYLGKEAEFYIKCYTLLKNMTVKEFNDIMGIDGKVLIKDLKEKLSQMQSNIIPTQSKRNKEIKLLSYNETDGTVQIDLQMRTFNMPYELYESLIFFDGKRSNTTVLKDIETNGLVIDDELLLYLHKHHFLESVEFQK